MYSTVGDFIVELEAELGDGYLSALAAGGGEVTFLWAAFSASQKNDAVVLDVGANIGFTSVLMNKLKPDAAIYAFEPSPTTFRYLKANVENNGLRRITPFQLGLGKVSGEFGWAQDPANSSSAHLLSTGGRDVRVTTVDDFITSINQVPTFIKIDVEGFELEVLKGAASTVGKGIAYFFIEVNSFALIAHGDVSPKTLLLYLLDRFEQIIWLDRLCVRELRTEESVLDFLHTQLTTGQCVHDLLCTPKGVKLDLKTIQLALPSDDSIARQLISASKLKLNIVTNKLRKEAPSNQDAYCSKTTAAVPANATRYLKSSALGNALKLLRRLRNRSS